MWIRSADNESLVNLNNISMVQMEQHDGKYMIVAYDTGSSDAVALETFDERKPAMDEMDGIFLGLNNVDDYVYELGGAE